MRGRAKFFGILVLITAVLLFLPAGAAEKVKLTWLSILSPAQQAVASFRRWVGSSTPESVAELQVEFLKRQHEADMLKIKEMEAAVSESKKLEDIDFSRRFDAVFADVLVPGDASPQRGSIVIAKGTHHGVRDGQVVVFRQHYVGRVHKAEAFVSRVILSTDPAHKVRALVGAADVEKRQVGMAQGKSPSRIAVRWITDTKDVDLGQIVATAADPNVPKGLILGRVLGLDGAEVVIEPSLQARSLEFVMVLVPK